MSLKISFTILTLALAAWLCCQLVTSNQTQPISSRAAFLRAQRASRQQSLSSPSQPQADNKPQPAPVHTGTALETSLPTVAISVNQTPQASNRTARTADVFQNGDGYNIFVTNTCERELMRVNIKTSRPFYGVIHTRNQRQKAGCSVEGNGETEFNLDINHVLNQQDPAYCGVVRARKESPDDKDLLSVVIAVRVHRNIELSDDKFFLLNCTK